MRNFLWFFLGFFVVFSTLLFFSTSHADTFELIGRGPIAGDFMVGDRNPAFQLPVDSYFEGQTLYHHSSSGFTSAWYTGNPVLYIYCVVHDDGTKSPVASQYSLNGFYSAPLYKDWFSALPLITPDQYPTACQQSECPDSDNDTVCDACDSHPDNPALGAVEYTKARYEFNGETVAVLTGSSASDSNYDSLSVLSSSPSSIPGYSMVVGFGMSGSEYIDESQFVAGGGKLHLYTDAPIAYRLSCGPPPATGCEDVECIFGDTSPIGPIPEYDPGDEVTDDNSPTYGPGENAPPDEPYPNRDCSEYSSVCNNICGSSLSVSVFECFDSLVNCECRSGGSFDQSPDPLNEEDGDSFGTDGSIDDDDIDGDGLDDDTVDGVIDGDPDGSGPDDENSDGVEDGYEFGSSDINFNGLSAAFGRLSTRFPFALVGEFESLYSSFVIPGECPSFSVDIAGHAVAFDLCAFDTLANWIRDAFGYLLYLGTLVVIVRMWRFL